MAKTSETDKKFKKLKKFTFENSTVSLWIVYRRLKQKVAKYKVKNVAIDDNLNFKLTNILKQKIKNSNEYAEYDYFTVDPDNKLLVLGSKETDFTGILEQINEGADSESVKSNEDLAKAWAYIIKIENDKNFILGYKKINENWDVRKRNNKINILFKDQKFIDLKENDVFKIEKVVDFIYFNESLFIANKKNLEIGLNFREGMKAKRDTVLYEFEALSIVSDINKIKQKVGSNIHYLRQLATINNNGYFRNPGFMDKLSKVNLSENWGLSIIDNQIQIDDDNIETVLRVLNKDRLKDLIEGDTFDVNVKKIVSVS